MTSLLWENNTLIQLIQGKSPNCLIEGAGMGYTVKVPNGQGGYEEGVPDSGKTGKKQAEALTRAAGPFYGNKDHAFDTSKPSGLRKAADFDKLRKTNLKSTNFGCNKEHRKALEKCA
jgi:hypothetical protein